MSARVSVIVVNLDGEHLLPDLLDSLAAQTQPAHEVIVVDNASQDFSREVVRARGGNVRLVEVERNVGASEARNLGTAAAQGDILAFVDNDSVADPEWIHEALLALERHPDWGAVGSLVYYHANRDVLNGCGADLNRSLFGRDHGFGRPASACAFAEDACLYAMSNGLFVRRPAAEAVGPWDRLLFYYYEDADFCLRLWLAGFAVGVAPRAVLAHKLSVSPTGVQPFKAYLNERHRIRIGLKYLTAAEWTRWLLHELTRPGGGPRTSPWASFLRMWAYNLAHLPSALAFRRRQHNAAGHARWRAFLELTWGPRELSLHNFRPAPDGCAPRDRIDAVVNGDDWRYGVYPTESLGGGTVAQWLDGDAAIDVVLTARCRHASARVYAPAAPRGVRAHLHLEDATGGVAWRGELVASRDGWSRPSWKCDVPPGRYRLVVQGETQLVSNAAGRRRLLLAYASICFSGD